LLTITFKLVISLESSLVYIPIILLKISQSVISIKNQNIFHRSGFAKRVLPAEAQ
jgi:hypothetical protein